MASLRPRTAVAPEFGALLSEVHRVGREVIAPAADAVDDAARFPHESIAALRELQLLSAYVPEAYGGLGLSIADISKVCEALGHYCASTAMIFAMHQIQVACIVHHARGSRFFEHYLRELVDQQLLIASATTELGVGGDLRSSICAIEVDGDRFRLVKKAPVISYGEQADAILVTSRRTPDAASSDQVHVLVRRGETQLEALSAWDTLGFRGTCSSGYTLSSEGAAEQIIPTPFDAILSQTMHPVSHIVWSSLWLGIAADAVGRARAFVRGEARKNPQLPPMSSLRLGEVDIVLNGMRNNVQSAVAEYARLLEADDADAFKSFGFATRINNLKLSSSQLVVDIVGKAMLICGLHGYRNDSKFTLGRHLRDAYGAALMVNNDRILAHNATMLLALKEA
ncbi:MAG: acyl-CoA/acyl-ACP dehydrogenase [Acidobacteria bacterium]|nr:acyl-CoA/acyl-ACP dehydrogenase [Acidobacteriota bacterium]MBV9478751.1 acyl-CoA/acyl-ACP dehydrogenase [Acidobacteriota bacterium]